MPRDKPSRLDNTPRFQGSYGDRRQEGREQEIVSGRDDDDVVFLVVELFEERGGTPSVSEDDDGLLLGILVELSTRVEVLLCDCVRGLYGQSGGSNRGGFSVATYSRQKYRLRRRRRTRQSSQTWSSAFQIHPVATPHPKCKNKSASYLCTQGPFTRLTFFLVPSLTVGAASVAGTLGNGVMGSRGGVGLVAYDRDERERRAAGDRRAEEEEVARREEMGEERIGRVRLADSWKCERGCGESEVRCQELLMRLKFGKVEEVG